MKENYCTSHETDVSLASGKTLLNVAKRQSLLFHILFRFLNRIRGRNAIDPFKKKKHLAFAHGQRALSNIQTTWMGFQVRIVPT